MSFDTKLTFSTWKETLGNALAEHSSNVQIVFWPKHAGAVKNTLHTHKNDMTADWKMV